MMLSARSLGYLLDRQLEFLCDAPVMADLKPFRNYVATVRESMRVLPPAVAEKIELIVAEIAKREETIARAKRVEEQP